jgi:uncharacterized protein YrzB (UPF0473 family)
MSERIVELKNQDGEIEKYIHIETIDYNDNKYVMLEPFFEEENEPEENEYMILRIDDKDGSNALVMIENKDEFEKVIEVFKEVLENEFDIE